ncbi:MAG: LysM peptidoglycan-binding domain-containing protein [Anaerolineae bacterium]
MRYKWLVIPLTVIGVLILGSSPALADSTHVVRRGENLQRIAVQYGTTIAAVMQANNLPNAGLVYAGQRLRIPTADNSPAPASSGVYVVRPGDTLFSIARRLGVAQQTLMQVNGIRDASFVWVGQRLQVPGRAGTPGPVQQTGPASTLARQRVHVVASGETLFSIATRYGVTVNSVVLANRLPAANRIIAGQQLIIPAGGSRPAVAAPTRGKWIDIDVGRQRLVAYEGDRAVFSAVVSTGKPGTPTVLGRFAVRSRLTSQRMIGPGYDIPNVPWVMYFHGAYAIHGAYWHKDFGRAVSHGCVNMRPSDAQWLFNWTPLGTPVVVHG